MPFSNNFQNSLVFHLSCINLDLHVDASRWGKLHYLHYVTSLLHLIGAQYISAGNTGHLHVCPDLCVEGWLMRLAKYFSITRLKLCLHHSYSTGPGIYTSKRTKSKGVAWGQGLLCCHKSMATCAITIIIISHLIGWTFQRMYTITMETSSVKCCTGKVSQQTISFMLASTRSDFGDRWKCWHGNFRDFRTTPIMCKWWLHQSLS